MPRAIEIAGSFLSLFVLSVGVTKSADEISFVRDIQPILAESCLTCHGADSGSREAGLRLDLRDAAIDAGVLDLDDPQSSEFLVRIYSEDPDQVMPPPSHLHGLSAESKDLLKRWVVEGAVYQEHWAFTKPERPGIPEVSNPEWIKNSVDAFVLAELDHLGLEPAPEVDPYALIRRVHLDITGLPPSPQAAAQFVADYQSDGDKALAKWIDRLMDLPAWGEHRARYWLDAARYADTHGLHFDNYREIWPYRDWVIRAFNKNQPFDQFTIEQLAGDLLPDPTDDQLIATGFQRCNITTNEGGTIEEENLALYASDRVQTFGWVFLGLTTNCSQCHDHKFDPITIQDYYSLAAFFRNTTQRGLDGNVKDGRGPVMMVVSDADRPRWQSLPKEIKTASEAKDAYRLSVTESFAAWLETMDVESVSSLLPAEDLQLHLPLNDGQGNSLANLAGGPEHIDAPDGLEWTQGGWNGPAAVLRPGKTINLGAAGDFDFDEAFSFGCWVNPQNTTGSKAIVAKMDESASHRGWDLWQEGAELAVHVIDVWPGNAIKVKTKRGILKAGQWQHVFVTYDGSGTTGGIRIFVNGTIEPHNTVTGTLQAKRALRTATPLRIGQRSSGSVFDGGSVQDFRLYSRLLADTEVKALADASELESILQIAEDKRTDQQREHLLDVYLTKVDQEYPKLIERHAALESERKAIEERSPITHIQEEKKDTQPMAHILLRGEYDQLGDQVSAATPQALHPMPEGAPNNRLGLARWVVDPANPLTARVTVNRFWQEIFGQGLVQSPEDFGIMGMQPSHPALLDWLALEFQEGGWDVKQLFKLLLTSSTYRQAALTTPEKLEKDRDNQWLSRGPRFRMDAEMIRDFALASSGLLSNTMYGPGTRPYQPSGIWDVVGLGGGNTRNYVQDTGENLYRRSLYTFIKRMAPPPNMEALNATNREVCTVIRERTNTPLQALVTLNDVQFFEAARVLAQEALSQAADDQAAVLQIIAERTLTRSLRADEQALLLEDWNEFLTHYQQHPDDVAALLSVGDSPVDTKLDGPTLAALTMVCNQFLNLDETITK